MISRKISRSCTPESCWWPMMKEAFAWFEPSFVVGTWSAPAWTRLMSPIHDSWQGNVRRVRWWEGFHLHIASPMNFSAGTPLISASNSGAWIILRPERCWDLLISSRERIWSCQIRNTQVSHLPSYKSRSEELPHLHDISTWIYLSFHGTEPAVGRGWRKKLIDNQPSNRNIFLLQGCT